MHLIIQWQITCFIKGTLFNLCIEWRATRLVFAPRWAGLILSSARGTRIGSNSRYPRNFPSWSYACALPGNFKTSQGMSLKLPPRLLLHQHFKVLRLWRTKAVQCYLEKRSKSFNKFWGDTELQSSEKGSKTCFPKGGVVEDFQAGVLRQASLECSKQLTMIRLRWWNHFLAKLLRAVAEPLKELRLPLYSPPLWSGQSFKSK